MIYKETNWSSPKPKPHQIKAGKLENEAWHPKCLAYAYPLTPHPLIRRIPQAKINALKLQSLRPLHLKQKR